MMMNETTKTCYISVRMHSDLYEKIQQRAKENKIRETEWVRRACEKVISIEENNSICMEVEELKKIIRDTVLESLRTDATFRETFQDYIPKKKE